LYIAAFAPPLLLACLMAEDVPVAANVVLVVPCILVVLARDLLTSSRSALRILVLRADFAFAAAFLVLWAVLASVAVGDSRACVLVFAAVSKLFELLEDAVMADAWADMPKTRVLFGLLRSAPIFVISSALVIAGALPNLRIVVWEIHASNVTDSNDPSSLDLSQAGADIGLSWAFHSLLRAAHLARQGRDARLWMESLKAPIAPRRPSGFSPMQQQGAAALGGGGGGGVDDAVAALEKRAGVVVVGVGAQGDEEEEATIAGYRVDSTVEPPAREGEGE